MNRFMQVVHLPPENPIYDAGICPGCRKQILVLMDRHQNSEVLIDQHRNSEFRPANSLISTK